MTMDDHAVRRATTLEGSQTETAGASASCFCRPTRMRPELMRSSRCGRSCTQPSVHSGTQRSNTAFAPSRPHPRTHAHTHTHTHRRPSRARAAADRAAALALDFGVVVEVEVQSGEERGVVERAVLVAEVLAHLHTVVQQVCHSKSRRRRKREGSWGITGVFTSALMSATGSH